MLVIAGLAVAIGVWLGVLWLKERRRTSLVSTVAWFWYAGYEYLMHARVLCSGECNIRVDLLVIWPVLIVMTMIVVIGHARGADKRQPGE